MVYYVDWLCRKRVRNGVFTRLGTVFIFELPCLFSISDRRARGILFRRSLQGRRVSGISLSGGEVAPNSTPCNYLSCMYCMYIFTSLLRYDPTVPSVLDGTRVTRRPWRRRCTVPNFLAAVPWLPDCGNGEIGCSGTSNDAIVMLEVHSTYIVDQPGRSTRGKLLVKTRGHRKTPARPHKVVGQTTGH